MIEKGLKMTIQVSKEALEKMFQGDKNCPEMLYFEQENDDRLYEKNESE